MVTALFRTFPPSSVGTRCRRTYGTGWPTSSVQTSGCSGDAVTGLLTYISRISFFVANRQFPAPSSSRMIWPSTGRQLDTLRLGGWTPCRSNSLSSIKPPCTRKRPCSLPADRPCLSGRVHRQAAGCVSKSTERDFGLGHGVGHQRANQPPASRRTVATRIPRPYSEVTSRVNRRSSANEHPSDTRRTRK
jgi:hypothetical protein